MRHFVKTLLLFALAAGSGCQPGISQQDLGFLARQPKPLTYDIVAKHLGGTEPGPGAFYSYLMRGTNQTVEFWMRPPPPPSQTTNTTLSVEIALVAVRTEGAKPVIIWPQDLKGKDFDAATAGIWPGQR